eukprot:TRINITY_DN6236_c0_g1_i1.p1 TRINITY_DN6236_c0_g1~~TRINITY_DN6236_c0_g1_i1.p1  ORF type:complete len:316 (-),score=59.80 TRINITY_DN6236_c0_g1_i1:14-940(-)
MWSPRRLRLLVAVMFLTAKPAQASPPTAPPTWLGELAAKSPLFFGTPSAAALTTLMGGFTVLWLISLAVKNASIVDSFWSLGFLWSYFVYASHPATAGTFAPRQRLVGLTMLLWAVRLSGYITWRNHGLGEDFRYQAFRKQFGKNFWLISYFQTFVLQAVLCWLVSWPLLAAQHPQAAKEFIVTDWAGLALWALGFLFESVGDTQLAIFKSDPANRGKLLTTGLWSLSRHPNYAGNSMMWWGWYLLGCAAPSSAGLVGSLLSPSLMMFLLLKVSGVALLERTLKKQKPEYATYIATTPAFFPRPFNFF